MEGEAVVTQLAIVPPPAPEAAHRSMAARSAEIEAQVGEAFEATLRNRMPAGLALAAVGGFGRRELFPYSDVDLLLLTTSDAAAPPKEAISAFLQTLWDSGLRPSHSVHSLDDCVREHDDNVEFTISLLDRRFLLGDHSLFDTMDQRYKTFLAKRGASIGQQIATLAMGRRAKYQNTIYHLEPNIKETPGGLRDLQTARWLQAIEPREGAPSLNGALDFLAGLRIRLHEIAGRDQNVLSFDTQDALAEQPGELMRENYRHARTVDRAVREAIEAATEKPGTLI